jgi:hypothetical protein
LFEEGGWGWGWMIAGKFDWGTLYGNITMICVNKKLLKKQVIQIKSPCAPG